MMKKATLQMEQLVCPACAQKIEGALKKTTGVSSVAVLFNSSRAKVEYDETITGPEALGMVVRTLGYDVLKIS